MNCKNIKYPILFSFLFFAGSIQGGYAQEASEVETGPDIEQASFTPPFDFPIVFSGNFGEIRSNHFHGGSHRQACTCFGRRAYLAHPCDARFGICARCGLR